VQPYVSLGLNWQATLVQTGFRGITIPLKLREFCPGTTRSSPHYCTILTVCSRYATCHLKMSLGSVFKVRRIVSLTGNSSSRTNHPVDARYALPDHDTRSMEPKKSITIFKSATHQMQSIFTHWQKEYLDLCQYVSRE
jgi:hypothetical protein